MRHAVQVDLIERLLGLIEDGATDVGEAATAWPVSSYFDPKQFAAEQTAIQRHPSILAQSTQVKAPGDFITDLSTGQNLIIARGHDGRIRGFLNACRHRGAQLVERPRGAGASFVCPYHAWTYDLEGHLTHVPDQAQSFPLLDKGERGLVEVRLEEHHGLIWHMPTGPDAPFSSVEDFLGPALDDEFEAYGFNDWVFYKQESWGAQVNWKGCVESFLENYHFAYLHRDSTNPIFVHNVGIYDQLNQHFRAIAPKKSMRSLKDVDRSEWEIGPNATILYVVFPLSIFFVEKHVYNLLQIFPTGVDSSVVRATTIVREDRLSMRPFYNANVALFMAAVKEDLGVCETIQRGVRSAANTDFLFGRNEVGCDLYRRCLQSAVQRAGGDAAPSPTTTTPPAAGGGEPIERPVAAGPSR